MSFTSPNSPDSWTGIVAGTGILRRQIFCILETLGPRGLNISHALQVDRVMKRLAEDGGFKKEYFALWNQQRKSSIFQYEEEAKKAAEVLTHTALFALCFSQQVLPDLVIIANACCMGAGFSLALFGFGVHALPQSAASCCLFVL